MKLKTKLFLILFCAGFFLSLIFHFSINNTIYPYLKNLNKEHIIKIKNRIERFLDQENASLGAICQSYTNWAGLIDYLQGSKEFYEKIFFSDSLFFNHMLDLFIISDDKNNLVLTKAYQDTIKFIRYPDLEIEQTINKIIGRTKENNRLLITTIKSKYGYLFIVAKSIRTMGPNNQFKYSGTLITGRFIDNKMLRKFSLQESESIKVIKKELDPEFHQSIEKMNSKIFQITEEENQTNLLYQLKDFYDTPVLIIKLTFTNKMDQIIKRHTLLYIFLVVSSLILWIIAIYIGVDKFFMKRITKISHQINKIQSLNNLSIRIDQDKQKDEISSLINKFNIMLKNFEEEKIKSQNVEKMLIINEKLISIGRLLSNYAHEVNNPIHAIDNCLQVIKKTSQNEDPKYQEALKISQREVTRIKNLISTLLDFHHFGQETQKNVSLNQIISEAIQLLKWSGKLKTTKIETDIPKGTNIYGSTEKIKQVFINLITNSIEAKTEKDCIITFKTQYSSSNKYIKIFVTDNGPGVPKEIRNKLFEPFISTKIKKGVGLGMYISFKIISNHKGELIYDETYKEGTKFIIKLPVQKINK